ncbi:MAG: hypothetical protein J0I17_03880 ['Candidatus Kapabacteria' thiocyanatum]|uniref:DUF5666 domain-containing protein n=1 Tax=Candidatus Kapaibacterium thiocyanatum TaxID=1895771 RepID=A0A1M3KXW0_9BACT|nr:hypothetical protein ['Candidatus Kapabacteria' thiocyanatum]OJX57281.1 MAG: hypothetical protein BGO89_12410 ['Candidatus Kapabacteria' thiocyanatum]
MKLFVIAACTLCMCMMTAHAQTPSQKPGERPWVIDMNDGSQWVSTDNGKNWQPRTADRKKISKEATAPGGFTISRLDASGLAITLPGETTGTGTIMVTDILGNILYHDNVTLSQGRKFEVRGSVSSFPNTVLAVTVKIGERVYREVVSPVK